ncbi:hypothetical protein B0H66DRAFT_563271 [Apodospora peruviana]|uniref:Biogenesis of lysosome-related organelles complex 1 subunit 1 n=1 Tax=Apodospora peruviana TaxID=516989 RepID=A0AAE0M0Q9_9PEZI|nr:hypothetical protein B0H66DRAFT_563271 [Apodospora peruviana]
MSFANPFPVPPSSTIPPPAQPSPASVTNTTVAGGSTSTSTSASTATAATGDGVSSTSSPPPLFPPLVNHNTAVAAPSQLTNTSGTGSGHHHHIHATYHHGHSRAASTSASASAAGPSGVGLPSTQRQIDEARNAVVASIGNMLDRELVTRGALLHANNAAIEKQEREIGKTLDGFRKDNDKLAKLAAENTKKIKEIGNVQNWAEMLEREFLILEETLRLAREGSDGEEGGSWSGSGSYSGSWSGSESGGEDGEHPEHGEHGDRGGGGVEEEDGDVIMGNDETEVAGDKGKGKEWDITLALAEAMQTDLLEEEEASRQYQEQDHQEPEVVASSSSAWENGNDEVKTAPDEVPLPGSPPLESTAFDEPDCSLSVPIAAT